MICQLGMVPSVLLLRALRTLRAPPMIASSNRFPNLESVPAPPSCVLCPVVWRTPPVRTLQLCPALCAGHNKWSKVKHVKGPRDVARAKMFAKFSIMIRIAVKEGGPNPDLNLNLAHVVEQCRSKNMPKASIDAVIKSAEKAKPVSQHMVEARGPGGCVLLIEVVTDNSTRTNQEIKHLLNKNGGMLSDGARHSFQRKGVVVVPGQNITTERALELAIEAGAEDVQETEDEEEKHVLQFLCDMASLHKMRASLKEMGMEIMSAGLEFVPHVHTLLDQDQLDAASTLIEALSDCPDVVRVWDNIKTDN